jgi:hypothetical protein
MTFERNLYQARKCGDFGIAPVGLFVLLDFARNGASGGASVAERHASQALANAHDFVSAQHIVENNRHFLLLVADCISGLDFPGFAPIRLCCRLEEESANAIAPMSQRQQLDEHRDSRWRAV